MKAVGFVFIVAALSGCGPYLGKYQVNDVKMVDHHWFQKIDHDWAPDRNQSDMLRVSFSSTINLEASSEGGDLYVVADFCPFSDGAMYLQGPYYSDKARDLPLRRISREVDGKTVEIVSAENKQPETNPSTGRYDYTAYLYADMPKLVGHGLPTRAAYDVRRDKRDICVRLHRTGYFITKSVSDIFVIRNSLVEQAVDEFESKRAPEAP